MSLAVEPKALWNHLHSERLLIRFVDMKNTLILAAAFALAVPSTVSAHCQVPCGIYDDDNVVQSMHTDWVTIEKASKMIIELSKDPAANAHQLTRWVVNKESHAQAIQDKVLNYFLAQRLNLPEGEADKELYLKKLALCHEIIVTAMKCKQSTDSVNVEKMHVLLHSFQDHFGSKD